MLLIFSKPNFVQIAWNGKAPERQSRVRNLVAETPPVDESADGTADRVQCGTHVSGPVDLRGPGRPTDGGCRSPQGAAACPDRTRSR